MVIIVPDALCASQGSISGWWRNETGEGQSKFAPAEQLRG
ncbi:MAG: hypothetical protein QOI74_3709 [Micromonosporaceae bacterium]|jgi:hypothetical protein|nr:hypothetical protein [Micromonosporaceae bacterium]